MAQTFAGRVAFVTGASSGIGEALARELATQGAKVAILARRESRLEALVQEIEKAGGEAMAIGCDVTKDGDVEAAVAKARGRWGRIDVVVANAGFGVIGRVEKLSIDDFRRQFETNVFGTLRTVYATLPSLKESRGVLSIVSSVSGYLPLPAMGPYTMSKFALRALAETLDLEHSKDGVTVLLVNPGFVESELRSVNNRGELVATTKDPVPAWLQMPKDVAAKKIAFAIARRWRERNLTAHAQIGIFLAKHLPWAVKLAMRSGKREVSLAKQ